MYPTRWNALIGPVAIRVAHIFAVSSQSSLSPGMPHVSSWISSMLPDPSLGQAGSRGCSWSLLFQHSPKSQDDRTPRLQSYSDTESISLALPEMKRGLHVPPIDVET